MVGGDVVQLQGSLSLSLSLNQNNKLASAKKNRCEWGSGMFGSIRLLNSTWLHGCNPPHTHTLCNCLLSSSLSHTVDPIRSHSKARTMHTHVQKAPKMFCHNKAKRSVRCVCVFFGGGNESASPDSSSCLRRHCDPQRRLRSIKRRSLNMNKFELCGWHCI